MLWVLTRNKAKVENDYVGFIQLSLRMDYVEGTSTTPIAYIEGMTSP